MMYTSFVKDFDLMQEVTTYLGQLSEFYHIHKIKIISWEIYMSDVYDGYRVEVLIDEDPNGQK